MERDDGAEHEAREHGRGWWTVTNGTEEETKHTESSSEPGDTQPRAAEEDVDKDSIRNDADAHSYDDVRKARQEKARQENFQWLLERLEAMLPSQFKQVVFEAE